MWERCSWEEPLSDSSAKTCGSAETSRGRQMQTNPSQNLSAAWMGPDMFVLGHRAHTCGTLSISPNTHWGNANGDTFRQCQHVEWMSGCVAPCRVQLQFWMNYGKKKKKKLILKRAWQSCGPVVLKQWSYLVGNTNVYSVALFTITKNRQTYKKSKNDKTVDARKNIQALNK